MTPQMAASPESEPATLSEFARVTGVVFEPTKTFADIARRNDAWILAGSVAEASDDEARPYNTSTLIAPDGSIAARYRKIHLFDVAVDAGPVDTESARVTAGVFAFASSWYCRAMKPP